QFILRGSGDVVVQQATIEKEWASQRVQLGMIRLPFGIYDYRETYASGLIDYPMPRVDYGLNAVDWGVPGAKWSGGPPAFQLEAAAFNGSSYGVWINIANVNGAAFRVKIYIHDLILGASRWDGYLRLPVFGPSGPMGFKHRDVHINGLDIRYTRPHLLVRGELL